ncbi:hypothetical protein G5V57_30035 [Nordella sp. HKS 07]|uniref:hypothetical protein n=1 Tax=Nordella sp. HKS 07 TaxID=2712222 RepID=UPI0013E171F4|nr:hypothetical protein [Nordella sp. HKS 07]QIG51580.1 hypothetical protein G5V57_30035 [Nordella sp. HKS 07]
MSKHSSLLLAIFAPVFAAASLAPAAEIEDDIQAQIKAYLNKRPERAFQVEQAPGSPVVVPPEARRDLRYTFQKRMAISGHGILFDIDGKLVNLEPGEADKLQAELLDALRREEPGGKGVSEDAVAKLGDLAKELDGLASQKLEPEQAAALRHLSIRALANRLNDERRSAYLWRANYLWHHYKLSDAFRLRPEILQVSERLRDILRELFRQTAYMDDCTRGGVPVPPDFSVSGSVWAHQGDLTINMLDPGGVAEVWTWASSSLRGACVALPRGTGGANSFAGIICQGAESGNACFWDNIERATGNRVPWASATMHINQLEDGSDLVETCPSCHKGNNVYLMAPDDPTWCRLLRGGQIGVSCTAPDGANAANLTLELDGNINPIPQPMTSTVHSSYRPMSGTPPRGGWSNSAMTNPSCGGQCHLNSVGSFTVPMMPPACGMDCY